MHVFWIVNCCIVFLLCVFCSRIVIPQILLIAFRKQLFDIPNERKIHNHVVPRLGGIAFKPVVSFSVALLLGINLLLGYTEMLSEFENEALPLAFGFCSIMVLYLVGMIDDLIDVRYKTKFVIQILCAIMLIVGKIWISDLHGILGIHEIPVWFGYPLTILVILLIINAINLIDGLDGLASGLCFFAYLLYGLVFFIIEQYIYSILSFATLGVLVSFFYYNVFGDAEQGKKIFMGDTGSLTIGMMLCFLSIKLVLAVPKGSTETTNPMILAFSPLLIPCLDVARLYLHRVRNKKNPFLPDNNHIHHKLLAMGMSQRTTMIVIVSASIIITALNILLSLYININWILGGDILIWIVINVWLSRKIKNKISNSIT